MIKTSIIKLFKGCNLKLSQQYFYPLLLLCVALISVTWFRGNFRLAMGDFVFPADRAWEFQRTLYSWDSLSLGSANFRILAGSLPYGIYFALTELMGLSLIVSEKIWVYFLFASMGISMYFLAITAIREKFRYLAGFLAALFFMFNPWTAAVPAMLFSYMVFLPLILGLYIKGLGERKGFKYIVLFCFLWIVTSTSGLINIRAGFHQWLTILTYFIFFLLTNKEREKIKHAFLFSVSLLFSWLLLSMFWLLPLFINILDVVQKTALVYQTIDFNWIDAYRLNSAPLIEALRLMGLWSFEASYRGYPYFYWSATYKNPLFILIGFLIPILAFFALFFTKKQSGYTKKNLLFFSIIILFGLFIAMGALNYINLLFVQHIPFFVVLFSLPYSFGGIFTVLGFSIMLGFSIAQFFSVRFFEDIKDKLLKTASMVLFFLLIGVYGFPVWSGEFLYPGNEVMASARYVVPKYYQDARAYLESQEGEFRIFPLPYSKLGYMAYAWPPKGFSGPDIVSQLLNRDTIAGIGIGKNFANKIADFSEPKLLGVINARYVFVHNDINWAFVRDHPWWIYSSLQYYRRDLKNQNEIFLKKSFGKLDFYKAPDDYFLPHFYIPQNIIYSTGGVEDLVSVVGFEDYKIRSGIYLSKTGELKEETASKLRGRADKIFIKTNLENSIGDNFFEKTRKRDNFKIGVPFPHVRHQPGSLAYRLALAREWLEEWRARNNQEELIEKKLFYAGKRISELESWGEEKRVQEITLRAYRLKMEEALEEAKQLPEVERRTEMMIKIGAYWEAHQERVEKIFINKQGKETTADEWRKMFAELAEKIDPLGSGDLKNLEYSLEVPKSGIYSLFIQEIDQLIGLEILTEGREIQIEEGRLVANEGWTEIGREEFNQGKNKLTLRLPESANLVGPDWQTRKELEKAEEGVGFFPQGFFPGAENLVFQEINDWQADNFYYLTFEYKIEKGSLGVGVLEERRKEAEEGTKITKIFTKNLKNQGSTEEWKKFEGFLTADKNALEAKIYFYSQADLGQFAEVEFRNLQVRKIVRPKIMLRAKTENINQEEQAMPRITFTKINPTKYRVRVEEAKEPYTLIFSESFHRGWRAYINKTEDLRGTTQNQEEIVASYFDGEIKEGVHRNIFLEKATFETWGKDPLPQERHLLVNGYANSWHITPEDSGGAENYEIIIEFQPQRLFYLGLFISGLTLIGSLGYLGYGLIKRKK